MSTERLVTVRDLHRHYGELHAVAGISFEIRRGEVLGFLGPNGAGKSTTMQMLCGALAPTAGHVEIDGVDLLERPREAKRSLGYLPEQPPLYRELTVDEYLAFCARLRGVPRGRVNAALDDAKTRCGLEASGRRLIGNLSKGYQQRVGIAQAILHRPRVVILDEPTVGLDPIQIREIRALIREIGVDHSVILSTHILPEVQAVCDRVLIIHRGRLVLNQPLAALEDQGTTRCLRVVLLRPPPADTLAALPGVEQVESLADGQFRLHHGTSLAPEDVAGAAVRGEWGLQELVPEQRSLEEIFVALTCGDAPEPDQEAA